MGKSKKKEAAADTGATAITATMMAANPAATKAWMDIVSESTQFVTDRLQQDLETQKAILDYKSPMELLQVQSEFFRTAMEQYTDEVTRLCKVMSKATEDTIKDARSGHSRGYDDVPL
ncbi:MAG: phasin family protein [Litoreibacter sp.]|nr:phasin family protein [Litoreibacter sp.]